MESRQPSTPPLNWFDVFMSNFFCDIENLEFDTGDNLYAGGDGNANKIHDDVAVVCENIHFYDKYQNILSISASWKLDQKTSFLPISHQKKPTAPPLVIGTPFSLQNFNTILKNSILLLVLQKKLQLKQNANFKS